MCISVLCYCDKYCDLYSLHCDLRRSVDLKNKYFHLNSVLPWGLTERSVGLNSEKLSANTSCKSSRSSKFYSDHWIVVSTSWMKFVEVDDTYENENISRGFSFTYCTRMRRKFFQQHCPKGNWKEKKVKIFHL